MKKVMVFGDYVDITPMEEDQVVLLNAEHQLGCTSQIYDILVDFAHNVNVDADADGFYKYTPVGVVEEDVLELLCLMSFAHKFLGGYFPTELYAIHSVELCQAVAQVIEAA